MKVKVGQWVRIKNNKIGKVITYFKGENTLFVDSFDGIRLCDITAVADTPQELVQVGDLIIVRGRIYEVKSVNKFYANVWYDGVVKNGMKSFALDSGLIIKILTPNSNGDYIKQWEVEDES